MAALNCSSSSCSKNHEELSGSLPLLPSVRYNLFIHDPPAVTAKRQRMALSGGDESPTNEPSTNAAQSAPEPVCRCNNCMFTNDTRDCKNRCCMDIREMRELCYNKGIPEEYITSHPGFLTIAFEEDAIRINHRHSIDRASDCTSPGCLPMGEGEREGEGQKEKVKF